MFGKSKQIKEAEALVRKLNKSKYAFYSVNELSGIEDYEIIKTKTETEKKEFIIALIDFVDSLKKNKQKFYLQKTSYTVMLGLLRSNLNYNETEWIMLFKRFLLYRNELERKSNLDHFPLNIAMQQIERYLKKHKASKELLDLLKSILKHKSFSDDKASYLGSDMVKFKKKIHTILRNNGEETSFLLSKSDIGVKANQIIGELKENKADYSEIFLLASEATQAKPTNIYQNKITEYIKIIGADNYRKTAQQLLKTSLEVEIEKINEWQSKYLSSSNQQFIKGIVWTMYRFSDKETIQILNDLLLKSYEKIPGQGPAAVSIGNACAYALGNMRGKNGLGALSRLKLKLKQNNIKKIINTYLIEGAKKYNVSVAELEEMAVPHFNLEKGRKTIAFEEYHLTIGIKESRVIQEWIKPDGSPIKSVPSAVKNSSALSTKLKEVRKEVKDIQKVYTAQKQRIDNQFILNRTWNFPSFQEHYLHNGLVYPITQKLIWTFQKNNTSVDAILLDDKWYSVENELIDWIDAQTTLKLWHPINANEKTIVAWREKMMELEWKQPIKQAYREIYILTDAEMNTNTYSNRMASHILKQHQFSALAGLRGWKYALLGAYDDGRDGETCQKQLPEYKLTVEFWIDEINQQDAWNDAGIWYYVSTDQVKFKNENGQTIALVEVPKVVFTEIMRDVDLFVGVASVGNDPNWLDNNGERQTNRDYWESYSFGDLTEIAKTRKSILENLLPRLSKIRDKSHIDGKFLVVKGHLRTYKIHIGSGNILMAPNDQYLCIVPSRSIDKTTDKIFIPFEGDKGLSIVLSKAFLLVADDKITDTTILSQIKG